MKPPTRLYLAGLLLAALIQLPACNDAQADGEGGKQGKVTHSDVTDSEIAVVLGGISISDVQDLRLLADRFNGFGKSDLDILWQTQRRYDIYGGSGFVQDFSVWLHSVTIALDELGLVSGLADSPAPTGDELFDRCALAVHQRLKAIGPDYIEVYQTGCVPDEELAEWESDFGDDPRYWEMRYLCTRSNDPLKGDLLPEWYERGSGFLEEAIDRGIATPNTYLLLCQDLRQCQARRVELTDPRADMPEELATRIMQLLNTAVELEHDQAWPLYERAFLHFELGEIELGMADLAAGNIRPVFQSPQAFPLREVMVGTHAGIPPGGAAVSGALLNLLSLSARSGPCSWRDHMEAALLSPASSGTSEYLDTWFIFYCRPGVESGAERGSWSALMDVFQLVDFASDNLADSMSETQVELLDRLRGWQEVAFAELMLVMSDNDWYHWQVPLSIAGRAHGDAVYFYLGEELEYRRQSEVLAPYFADLKDVSFSADVIPESLLKYEPFTMEECEQRGREKREARDARDARVAAQQAADSGQ